MPLGKQLPALLHFVVLTGLPDTVAKLITGSTSALPV